jgi:hypothetical protein
MRTFYEASAAEEEDRRRRRSRGDSMEDSAVEDHVWFEDRWMVASLCDE